MSTRVRLPLPGQRDELAARRAAKAAHPAGGRITETVHQYGEDAIACAQCGCRRWRTEYVQLRWDPDTARRVHVAGGDDLVWCVDCGHELLLPELTEEW